MVAVPGFYNQKRSTTKPHVTETRPEVGGVAGEGSRVMEEVTVEQNLDTSDSTFSTHSIEKTDTFNAPIYSGNVYSENKGQDLNIPPHNSDKFNAENLWSNQHGKIGASCQTNPTDPIGITPINILSKYSNNNDFLEVARANANAHTSILNPLSCEGHEFTRATKKMARGQGWIEASLRNKLLRHIPLVHVNEKSLQLMITLNYLATKNRF